MHSKMFLALNKFTAISVLKKVTALQKIFCLSNFNLQSFYTFQGWHVLLILVIAYYHFIIYRKRSSHSQW